MDAYLFGRIGGEVRSFTLPEDREALDGWAAQRRATARDVHGFDDVHRLVNAYVDTAAEATAQGTFVSISWTDGEVPLTVSYHLLPREGKENSCGSRR